MKNLNKKQKRFIYQSALFSLYEQFTGAIGFETEILSSKQKIRQFLLFKSSLLLQIHCNFENYRKNNFIFFKYFLPTGCILSINLARKYRLLVEEFLSDSLYCPLQSITLSKFSQEELREAIIKLNNKFLENNIWPKKYLIANQLLAEAMTIVTLNYIRRIAPKMTDPEIIDFVKKDWATNESIISKVYQEINNKNKEKFQKNI